MTDPHFNRCRPMTGADYAELGIDDPNELWDQFMREGDTQAERCEECGDETGECHCDR